MTTQKAILFPILPRCSLRHIICIFLPLSVFAVVKFGDMASLTVTLYNQNFLGNLLELFTRGDVSRCSASRALMTLGENWAPEANIFILKSMYSDLSYVVLMHDFDISLYVNIWQMSIWHSTTLDAKNSSPSRRSRQLFSIVRSKIRIISCT